MFVCVRACVRVCVCVCVCIERESVCVCRDSIDLIIKDFFFPSLGVWWAFDEIFFYPKKEVVPGTTVWDLIIKDWDGKDINQIGRCPLSGLVFGV